MIPAKDSSPGCAAVLALVALVTLGACSSSQRTRDIATYAALSAADVATTYVAIQDGFVEVNPIMRVGGDEAWQTAATVAVVSVLTGLLVDRLVARAHRGHQRRPWFVLSGLKGAAAAWNLKLILETPE